LSEVYIILKEAPKRHLTPVHIHVYTFKPEFLVIW